MLPWGWGDVFLMGCFIFKWGVHLTGGASALIGEGGFSKKIVGSEGGEGGGAYFNGCFHTSAFTCSVVCLLRTKK